MVSIRFVTGWFALWIYSHQIYIYSINIDRHLQSPWIVVALDLGCCSLEGCWVLEVGSEPELVINVSVVELFRSQLSNFFVRSKWPMCSVASRTHFMNNEGAWSPFMHMILTRSRILSCLVRLSDINCSISPLVRSCCLFRNGTSSFRFKRFSKSSWWTIKKRLVAITTLAVS